MANKKLIEIFGMDKEKNSNKTSYTFPKEELLEELRKKIINILLSDSSKKIDEGIKEATEGLELTNMELNYLSNLIENELLGQGPLFSVLKDELVKTIMINGKDEVYIETNNQIIKDDSIKFIDESHIIRTITNLLKESNQNLNLDEKIIDTRLDDGTRINGILPPLAKKGPVFTIHKFQKNINTMEDYVRLGSLTTDMANFLEATLKAKANILITGLTGSGATSILRTLGNSLDDDKRIITLEEISELNLIKPNLVSLELHNNNIPIKEILKKVIRMNPNYLLVNDLFASDFLSFLEIMNLGVDGIVATMHARDIKDALKRIELEPSIKGLNIPLNIMRENIVNAFNIIINVEKMNDNKQKITSISELKYLNGEIKIEEIFSFQKKSINQNEEVIGEYTFYPKNCQIVNIFRKKGIHDIDYLFNNKK